MRWADLNIQALLDSSRCSDQLRGLQILGARTDKRPSESVISRAVQLMDSTESSVKEAAVFALCLHLAEPGAFGTLKSILADSREAPDVLAVAARSVPLYVGQESFNSQELLRLLASIVINDSLDREVRGISYVSILEILGMIGSKRELARMPDDIAEHQVDWEWVERLAKD